MEFNSITPNRAFDPVVERLIPILIGFEVENTCPGIINRETMPMIKPHLNFFMRPPFAFCYAFFRIKRTQKLSLFNLFFMLSPPTAAEIILKLKFVE